MKELSIKKLIEFKGKSAKGKKTFVENIKSNKIEVSVEGGGDYWVTSISAISSSYKKDDSSFINDKIEDLEERLRNTNYSISKTMYLRNINILRKYKYLELNKLSPTGKIEYLNKSSANPIIVIKGLKIKANPNLVFKFTIIDIEYIGAIWFVAKLKGYSIEEIGMFTDLLYKYLKSNFSMKYQMTPKYCIVVDVISGIATNYSQIEMGNISSILIPTIDEINNLM